MPVHSMPSIRFYALMAAAAPVLAGCGRYVVTADDVITRDGQKAVFAAAVLRDYGSSFHQNIAGVEVQFVANGQVVARGITNADGRAVADGWIGPDVQMFEARTRVKGQKLSTAGPVFRWSPNKTAIAIDMDETISATRYSDLFFAVSDHSQPIRGAQKAVWALSKHYEILYVSARPQFLQEKTHEWLRSNGFPPAPYLGADRFAACLNQAGYKQRLLSNVKARWPNLLIGIGDKREDDKACGANEMLTFIVNPFPIGLFTHRCILMKDWDSIQALFAAQSRRLTDPMRLAGILKTNGEELRPVFEEAPSETATPQVASVEPSPVHAQTVARKVDSPDPRF